MIRDALQKIKRRSIKKYFSKAKKSPEAGLCKNANFTSINLASNEVSQQHMFAILLSTTL